MPRQTVDLRRREKPSGARNRSISSTLIKQELSESGTVPANLVFEITETALMEDIELGEAFAHAVAELGCGLALDDFGTGFGNFTCLKKLPITHLKIDIEFLRDLVFHIGRAAPFVC
jgi:EAL domain-containing protein (putative c-di-GMP-specific phosphodiesterase class I)